MKKVIIKKQKNLLYVLNPTYNSDAIQSLLLDPEQAFQNIKPESFLKNGDTTTVIKLKIDDKEIVIKRYNRLGIWHGIRRGLRCSRAKRSWVYAWHLLSHQIPTPTPIAFVEKNHGIFKTSYFLNDFLEGISARDFFDNKIDLDPSTLPIAHKISEIINKLLAQPFIHGDLKATNILLSKEQPYLIDLDGAKHSRFKFILNKVNQHELKRFLKNWLDQPLLFNFFCRNLRMPK